jgi:hypothetical protein
MFVYYQVITSKKINRLILILALVFTGFAVFNEIYFQGLHNIDSFTLAMASGIIIFVTVTFFNELLKDKDIIRLSRHPMVWISAGALIFNTAELPYILSLNYLNHNDIPLAIALFYVFLTLNCIMYSLYIIAFLCPPPLPKS